MHRMRSRSENVAEWGSLQRVLDARLWNDAVGLLESLTMRTCHACSHLPQLSLVPSSRAELGAIRPCTAKSRAPQLRPPPSNLSREPLLTPTRLPLTCGSVQKFVLEGAIQLVQLGQGVASNGYAVWSPQVQVVGCKEVSCLLDAGPQALRERRLAALVTRARLSQRAGKSHINTTS